MNVSIRKMGNSAGVIIPKAVLANMFLETGDSVDMTFDAGRVILTPVKSHPRAGWEEEARAIVAAGEDELEWPEFANEADDEWEW